MARVKQARPSDSRRYYDWLARAGEDVLSAYALLQNEACYNNSAFHCQQTIEKALKAYILFCTGLLPDGHNLTWLCKRAAQQDADFAKWLPQSAALNKCYIETRYPADEPLDLNYAKVNEYYQMAKEMYLFICGEVDGKVGQERQPAPTRKKRR